MIIESGFSIIRAVHDLFISCHFIRVAFALFIIRTKVCHEVRLFAIEGMYVP